MQEILKQFNGLIKDNKETVLIPLFDGKIGIINKDTGIIDWLDSTEIKNKLKEINLIGDIVRKKNGDGVYFMLIKETNFCIARSEKNGFEPLSEMRKLNLMNLIKLLKNGR